MMLIFGHNDIHKTKEKKKKTVKKTKTPEKLFILAQYQVFFF